MTFLRPIPGRTFLPTDDVSLVASVDDSTVKAPVFHDDLEDYYRELRLSSVMSQRVGVCG